MKNRLVRFQIAVEQQSERGASMAEYGLLLVFVGLAAVIILQVFGQTLVETFGFANDTLIEAPGMQEEAEATE